MALQMVFFRNEEGAPIYLTVYDNNLASDEPLFKDKFLGVSDTHFDQFEFNGTVGNISWGCYRQDNPDDTGVAENVEVSAGSTVPVRTD